MEKDKPIWSGKRIMDRWGISSTELGSWIYHGLPAYQMVDGEFRQVPKEQINHFDEDHMTDFVFLPADVAAFEKEYGPFPPHEPVEPQLAGKEAQELGRLREEKNKWASSIVAAVHAGIFCATIGRAVVRKEVDDVIMKKDPRIPNTTMNKIWKALPNKYKSGAGRPKTE